MVSKIEEKYRARKIREQQIKQFVLDLPERFDELVSEVAELKKRLNALELNNKCECDKKPTAKRSPQKKK